MKSHRFPLPKVVTIAIFWPPSIKSFLKISNKRYFEDANLDAIIYWISYGSHKIPQLSSHYLAECQIHKFSFFNLNSYKPLPKFVPNTIFKYLHIAGAIESFVERQICTTPIVTHILLKWVWIKNRNSSTGVSKLWNLLWRFRKNQE